MLFDSIRMSRPKARTVHGVAVRKLPISKYMDMLETLSGALYRLTQAAFPGMNANDVLAWAKKVTKEDLQALMLRVMQTILRELLTIVAELLEVEPAIIRDRMTPAELSDVLIALAEVNDYRDFFTNMQRLAGIAERTAGTSILSSDGSLSGFAQASESENWWRIQSTYGITIGMLHEMAGAYGGVAGAMEEKRLAMLRENQAALDAIATEKQLALAESDTNRENALRRREELEQRKIALLKQYQDAQQIINGTSKEFVDDYILQNALSFVHNYAEIEEIIQ